MKNAEAVEYRHQGRIRAIDDVLTLVKDDDYANGRDLAEYRELLIEYLEAARETIEACPGSAEEACGDVIEEPG